MRHVVTRFLLVGLCLAGCTGTAGEQPVPNETLPGSVEAASSGASPETSSPVTSEVPEGDRADITRMLDGDSFEAEVDGRSEEVRMIGINAPEGDECYGDAARAALGDLVGGGPITLVAAGEDDRDRFGRLLRFVYADGVLVNREMVRLGAAVVFQGGQPLEAEFKSLEDEAFEAGRGMWSSGVCGDRPRPDVVILTVEYDPPGRDFENKEEEYVGLGNAGTTNADLAGWTLRDETSEHRFTFPDGFTLPPDGVVRIRVGCGTDDPDDLYWCNDDAVWSNGGDTALLLDPDGNVVDRFVYTGDF
jgi:endonuclease YncB( thermonuclease family)